MSAITLIFSVASIFYLVVMVKLCYDILGGKKMDVVLEKDERRLLLKLEEVRKNKVELADIQTLLRFSDEHFGVAFGRLSRLGLVDGSSSIIDCEISEKGRAVLWTLTERRKTKRWIIAGVAFGAIAAIASVITIACK